MTEPVAVIDLGTNTFHLLIARLQSPGQLHGMVRERHFVRLARSGLDRICPDAMEDAEKAAQAFATHLGQWNVRQVCVLATAAFRTASNASSLSARISEILGHPIRVLDGQQEAGFIAEGVRPFLSPRSGSSLIMDVGGGSVEFIHMDGLKIRGMWSLPIGAGTIHHRFFRQEPIPEADLEALRTIVDRQLRVLPPDPGHGPIRQLIGTAGIFEVLANTFEGQTTALTPISPKRIQDLWNRVRYLGLDDRCQQEDIPAERADLLPAAMVLIERTLHRFRPERIMLSPFALKEGCLFSTYLT